jgi:DNA polymerase sigma
MRDAVIARVKDAFLQLKVESDESQSHALDGEITVVATGSCQNGLWTVLGSDIDLVIVFHNRMAHNQHFLIKHCVPVVKKVAKPGTLVYVPAVKVPILKYKDFHSGIDVDISVNNILATYNSDLIHTYC